MFVVLYLAVGLSDVLDGWLARRYHLESRTGALLDSLGDLAFYLVLVVMAILFFGNFFAKAIWPILAILVLKGLSLGTGLIRFRKPLMIHTVANKAAGFLVYLVPLLLVLGLGGAFCQVPVWLAVLAAAEELAIVATCREPDVNRRSLFTGPRGGR